MSLQVQPLPQQQQEQPVQVYPTTYTYESPPHHSNGSFGSVFVVLAIIIVISAVACCLGRLCNRKSYKSSSHSQKHNTSKQQKHQNQKKQNNKNHNLQHKEVDIEFGFDKKIAASKPNNGHGYGPHHGPHGHGAGRGPLKPLSHHGHGDMKGFEIKLGPEGKLRAGP